MPEDLNKDLYVQFEGSDDSCVLREPALVVECGRVALCHVVACDTELAMA